MGKELTADSIDLAPVTELDINYWQKRYENEETGWDIGYVSTPLQVYFDQISDKGIRVLIPGAGNSYEAEYLARNGFSNVTVLDIATPPLENFKRRVPGFPEKNIVCQDFFEHQGVYDLIVEQTFFCALDPKLRPAYAKKAASLLAKYGKLTGVLFDDEMNDRIGPPFGGTKAEYAGYFKPYFDFLFFDRCYNSIEPRKDRELFLLFRKREMNTQTG